MAKAAAASEPKAKPRISVLERRLQNPFGEPSAPVDLKDKSRECRWFNAAKTTDHIWRAKQKGWEPVKPDDVVDLDMIGGYVLDASGFITRGERGQEILMSMPKEWRQQIAMAKTRENLKNMGNPNATKRDVVEAASKQLGDQAASYLQDHIGPVGQVVDSYERIQVDPGDE